MKLLSLVDSKYLDSNQIEEGNKTAFYCQAIDNLKKSISDKKIEYFSLSGNQPEQYFEDDLIWYEINSTNYPRGDYAVIEKATFYTSHYVGFYSSEIKNTKYGNLQINIEIKPRFGNGIFNYLISYTYGIYLPKSEFSSNKNRNNNLWLIAMMWKATLEKAMTKSQIPKEYKAYEKNISNFKGQLKISKHIKHNLVDKSKFYCKYRKLTMDTAINQTIRHTYRLLVKKQKGLSGILRSIAEYDAMLQSFGVQNKDMSISEIKNIKYSKLNFHYKKVMELSSLIIKSESAKSDPSVSDNNSFSYFLDVAELWENYLLKVLQKNLPEYNIYSPNERGGEYLLEDNYRQIRPDIIIKEKGKVIAVLDAKYKFYNKLGATAKYGISRDDLYQMSTYLYHYGDKDRKVLGLFISPVESNEIKSLKHNNNHRIGVLGLDIEQFRKTYDDNKKEIKDSFSNEKINNAEENFIINIKKALVNNT